MTPAPANQSPANNSQHGSKRNTAMLALHKANAVALVVLASLPMVAGLATASPAAQGSWSDVLDWPHVPISAAVLESGEILTWASNDISDETSGINSTESVLWNPDNGQFFEVNNPTHDMFCSGISTLSDGSIMATGGNPSQQSTSIFNPQTRQWSTGPFMNQPRWYGSQLTTAENSVVTTYAQGDNNIPEILQGNAWLELPGATMSTLYNEARTIEATAITNAVGPLWYANIQVAPNGKIFHAGPTLTMHWMSTDGEGQLDPIGVRIGGDRHRQGNTFSMYDVGKLLMTGGADQSRQPSGTFTAMTFDINGASPEVQPTANMLASRVYHNAVVLPHGEVLIIGGNSDGVLFSDQQSVLVTEIWNPDSGQFRTGAPISIPRNYHSVALLMKDARVFAGGGGQCRDCEANHPDAQIYSPAYLFDENGQLAARPEITRLRGTTQAGGNLLANVETAENAPVSEFVLMRVGTVTHSVNTDERRIPVSGRRVADNLQQLTLPDNPNVLIPGTYWLFAVNAKGVPSVGHALQIAEGVSPVREPMSLSVQPDVTVAAGSPIELVASASNTISRPQFSSPDRPTGLRIDASSGIISGVIAEPGNYTMTVLAQTDTGQARAAIVNFSVTAAIPDNAATTDNIEGDELTELDSSQPGSNTTSTIGSGSNIVTTQTIAVAETDSAADVADSSVAGTVNPLTLANTGGQVSAGSVRLFELLGLLLAASLCGKVCGRVPSRG